MTKDERESKAAEIRRLWLTGEWKKSQIAQKVGCSPPHVTQVIARSCNAGCRRIQAHPVRGLRHRNRTARRCGCGFYYVQSLTRGVPRELLCQRPDVKNGLKPCGRPRHRLRSGDLLGVCKEHWETGHPIGGQKL